MKPKATRVAARPAPRTNSGTNSRTPPRASAAEPGARTSAAANTDKSRKPAAPARSSRDRPPATPVTNARSLSSSRSVSFGEVRDRRELFWHNVVREFLTNLSILSAQHSTLGAPPEDNPFDGRLGIITSQGVRISIGAIAPMFACGINGTQADRDLSMDVECTVFQIETPEGEVFTLPLHEIRCFHALTASLIEQIKAAARPEGESADDQMPFGFAAFTAMARSQRDRPFEITTIVGPDLDPADSAASLVTPTNARP